VHGGAFVTGSSDSKLYAPDYLMDQDIILVTLNYRLSALGEEKRIIGCKCQRDTSIFLRYNNALDVSQIEAY